MGFNSGFKGLNILSRMPRQIYLARALRDCGSLVTVYSPILPTTDTFWNEFLLSTYNSSDS